VFSDPSLHKVRKLAIMAAITFALVVEYYCVRPSLSLHLIVEDHDGQILFRAEHGAPGTQFVGSYETLPFSA